MAVQKQTRRYNVKFTIEGDVERVIQGTSEKDALEKAKKLLLAADGSPKSNAINAFCWDISLEDSRLSWRDLTEEERRQRFGELHQDTDAQTEE